jgi:hypothetical protein
VRSPAEDNLPLIRAALDAGELRPAVGAESMSASRTSMRDLSEWLDRKRAAERAEEEEQQAVNDATWRALQQRFCTKPEED